VVGRPKGLLIMNGPSMEKFLPMLSPGGDLIINSSLVEERQVNRDDVRLLSVPADDIARNRIGSRQTGVDGRPRRVRRALRHREPFDGVRLPAEGDSKK